MNSSMNYYILLYIIYIIWKDGLKYNNDDEVSGHF